MNNNTVMFLLTALGALLGEITGIWMVKWSHKFPNPMLAYKIGKLACIMGIVGFILAFIAWRLEMWA